MTNLRRIRFSVPLICLLVLAACGGRQADPATLAPDDLYQRASTAYEAKSYGRAIPLLDAFVQHHIGDPRAPQARLMLGRAHMAKKEYVTAASHFQRFVEDFPTSPQNLEARFAICESYFALSPRPQLDQEYTEAALAHCESVASNFQGTPEAQNAAARLVQLREKLADKSYQTGLFYHKRKAYDAAVIYFDDVLTNFPEAAVAPQALGKLVETYTTMGYKEEAEQSRERLLREYPSSAEARGLPPVATPGAGADTVPPETSAAPP